MTELSGSTVLVTGAASGIGRLMAMQAAERGAHVVAWDLNAAGLQDVVSEITAQGGNVLPQVVDVTDRSAVYAAADETRARVGPVDVLILNAGVVGGRRFLDLPDDAIQRVFDVNAIALFWCTKAFLPDMVERDAGHIVVISSLAAVTPLPGLTAYVASKHAAYGFIESLRTELADDAPGVRTTVVLPQVIDTGMFAGVSLPRLFPALDPQRVAAAVLAGVERNRDRVLLHRPALLTGYVVRLLPPSLADRVSRLTGAFDSMSTFSGRSVIDSARTRRGA
jgi:all-trans-retinol dehydrogenase (NAD+)